MGEQDEALLYASEDAYALDFAVRAAILDAGMDLAVLRDCEQSALLALTEVDAAYRGLSHDQIFQVASADLGALAAALQQSDNPEQADVYARARRKADLPRMFDGGIVTILSSVTILVVALRVGVIQIGPSGRGVTIRLNGNREKLSESLKGLAEILRAILDKFGGNGG